jgi:hypothetical protein
MLIAALLALMSVRAAPCRAESPAAAGTPTGVEGAKPAAAPFRPGEKLVFSVEYGFISAGEATMEVAGVDTIDGHPVWHFRTIARTNEFFDALFRVEDRVESHMDMQGFFSRHFRKSLREGSYSKEYEVWFDHDTLRGRTAEGDTLEILPETQDVLSAFFYLRTQDLHVGATLSFPCHDNGKNYPLVIKVHRKEKVVVPAGRFVCYVVEPMLKSGGLTRKEARMLVWLTADERRMPVRMETKIKVGAIAAKLKSFEAGPVPGDGP